MIDRFAQFPRDLARRARNHRLGRDGIPALLAHPDWSTPAPTAIWLHGRTVNKELDPGRYLRWVRAGIAVCAIDLPGHGERAEPDRQSPAGTLGVLRQAVNEIDEVVESLASPEFAGVFDLDRLAIGGMSLGGMASLRRLCDEHPFLCAAVECTTGDLGGLYGPDGKWPVRHDPAQVAELDPLIHLHSDSPSTGPGWRPIPILLLHSDADRVVPVQTQHRFVDHLRSHYRALGADERNIEFVTWPSTGAPDEHSGFGRVSNDAKNLQVAFLSRHLHPTPPPVDSPPIP